MLAPDGKPIFKGPRVAMALHQSCEFTSVSVPRQEAAADGTTTDYLGTGVERVQQLRCVAGCSEGVGVGGTGRCSGLPACDRLCRM